MTFFFLLTEDKNNALQNYQLMLAFRNSPSFHNGDTKAKLELQLSEHYLQEAALRGGEGKGISLASMGEDRQVIIL